MIWRYFLRALYSTRSLFIVKGDFLRMLQFQLLVMVCTSTQAVSMLLRKLLSLRPARRKTCSGYDTRCNQNRAKISENVGAWCQRVGIYNNLSFHYLSRLCTFSYPLIPSFFSTRSIKEEQLRRQLP